MSCVARVVFDKLLCLDPPRDFLLMSSSDSASSADAKTKDVPSESDDDAAAGSSDGESDAASGSDSDAAAGSSDGESDAASGSVSKCELCEQLYGQVDKDNPKQGTGFDAVVTEARNGGQECTSCFYNRRGSFKKLALKLAIKYYATNINSRGNLLRIAALRTVIACRLKKARKLSSSTRRWTSSFSSGR
jgi:hypothetical protein